MNYHSIPEHKGSVVREEHVEYRFLRKLQELKHEYRGDITTRADLEENFREKFETLNRIRLTNATSSAATRTTPKPSLKMQTHFMTTTSPDASRYSVYP